MRISMHAQEAGCMNSNGQCHASWLSAKLKHKLDPALEFEAADDPDPLPVAEERSLS